MQNVVNYFVTLPSEVAMKLWGVLGEGPQENVVALHKGESADGRAVASMMVKMFASDSN